MRQETLKNIAQRFFETDAGQRMLHALGLHTVASVNRILESTEVPLTSSEIAAVLVQPECERFGLQQLEYNNGQPGVNELGIPQELAFFDQVYTFMLRICEINAAHSQPPERHTKQPQPPELEELLKSFPSLDWLYEMATTLDRHPKSVHVDNGLSVYKNTETSFKGVYQGLEREVLVKMYSKYITASVQLNLPEFVAADKQIKQLKVSIRGEIGKPYFTVEIEGDDNCGHTFYWETHLHKNEQQWSVASLTMHIGDGFEIQSADGTQVTTFTEQMNNEFKNVHVYIYPSVLSE